MRSSLLVVLLLSTSLPSYAVKDNKTLDVLSEMKTDGIYDQKAVYKGFSKVLEQEGLSSLLSSSKEGTMKEEMELLVSIQTPKALNEALEKEFISRKRKAMLGVLSERGLPFAFDFGCTTVFGLSGLLGNFGAGMALFKALKSCETFTSDLSSGGAKIYDLKTDELFKYELQYVNKKRFLEETLQVAIEDKFSTARKDPKNLKDAIGDYFPLVLNLPTKTRRPNPDFEGTLRQLTKGYIVKGKESLADILVDVAMTHYTNFKSGVGPNSKPKTILYIVGPAGVGKTYIAKSLSRALFGTPVKKVSLSGGTAKVFGDKNNPGQFLEAIAQPDSFLNDVVLFDEANHSLNGGVVSKNHPGTDVINSSKTKLTQNSDQATWLEFFDPATKTKFFPFLNAEQDISHYLKVATGNDIPQNGALRNRMRIIEVTGLEPGFKRDIVMNHILPELMESEDPLMRLVMSELNTDVIDEIIKEADKKEEISKEEKKEKKKKKKEEQKEQPLLQLLGGETESDDDEEDIGFRTITKDLQAYLNKIRLQRLKEFNEHKRKELEKEKLTDEASSIVLLTTEPTPAQKNGSGLRKRGNDTHTLSAENVDSYIQLLYSTN